jgi:hypothetical protein
MLILSSESPGAVEALCLLLLQNQLVKQISDVLRCGRTFPNYFQVLFSVAALETDPETFVSPLKIEEGRSLTSSKANSPIH